MADTAKSKIGPWFATPTSGRYGHVSSYETDVENDGGDIATTWCGEDAKDHALLISAAPDLLEAIKHILAPLYDEDGIIDLTAANTIVGHGLHGRLQLKGSFIEAIERARAAVSKAEGV